MNFEEQFPELNVEDNDWYHVGPNCYKTYRGEVCLVDSHYAIKIKDIHKNCLSKQRVKEAFNKYSDHDYEKVCGCDWCEFWEKLGLEDIK